MYFYTHGSMFLALICKKNNGKLKKKKDLYQMSFKPNYTPNNNLIKNTKCAYGEGNNYHQVRSLRFYYYVMFYLI